MNQFMKCFSVKILGTVSILIVAVFLGSCGGKEQLDPLYTQNQLTFKPITITVESKIGQTIMEPGIFRKIFGFIPGLGKVLNRTLDLFHALIPALPFKDRTPFQLPDDVPWTNPDVLPYITSVKLVDGYIRIVPEKERGPNYKPEKCRIPFLCGKQEDLEFLERIKVDLIFKPKRATMCRAHAERVAYDCVVQGHSEKQCTSLGGETEKDCFRDSNPPAAKGSGETETRVPLAYAARDRHYNKKDRVLRFVTYNQNLKEKLAEYGQFIVDIDAKGKFPRRNTYIDGTLTLEFQIQLPDPY